LTASKIILLPYVCVYSHIQICCAIYTYALCYLSRISARVCMFFCVHVRVHVRVFVRGGAWVRVRVYACLFVYV